MGVSDKNLGPSIKEIFPNVDVLSNEIVQDFLRGIRVFGAKLFKDLQEGDIERAQLGLGHAFQELKSSSRYKRMITILFRRLHYWIN